MNRVALETVLSHDVNARFTGRSAPAMSGAGAVVLETALCKVGEPCLGLRAPLARLLLRYGGPELLSRVRRTPPSSLPVHDCLKFARGHVRYVALSAGGHIAGASIEDLARWFAGRPYELWYAIQDAGRTAQVPFDLLRSLPKKAAFSLLMAHGDRYDLAARMAADLVPKMFVARLVRRHPGALLPLDWISTNLTGVDLVSTLAEVAKVRPLPRDYVLASATPAKFKIDVLSDGGGLASMTPDELAAAFPDDVQRCIMEGGHAPSVAPDWLRAHVSGADLLFLLCLGGHIGCVTPQWLAANLDRSLLGRSLASRDDLDPDWVVANVAPRDVLRCLGGSLWRLDLAWLEANVPREDLYHAVVLGGHASELSRDWFLDRLPHDVALRALTVYGHIGADDRAFVFSRWRGRALLDAVVKNGLDPGTDMTLDQVAEAYAPDAVYEALVRMGDRVETEYIDALAAVLPPEAMKAVLLKRGCLDEDEFARFLDGPLLLDALVEAEVLESCSLDFLTERFGGELLLRALDEGDHLHNGTVDADCVAELFEPRLALRALELSGTLSLIDHEQIVRHFGHDTALLRRALVAAWQTPVADPERLRPLFGDDLASLAAVVRETTAYARMDPDDFTKYGIVCDDAM